LHHDPHSAAAIGLRKAGAMRAAKNGATVNQLMALFGWKTEKMALLATPIASALPRWPRRC